MYCSGKCLELQPSDIVPPRYSSIVLKPMYESPEAQAYWDSPAFAASKWGRTDWMRDLQIKRRR